MTLIKILFFYLTFNKCSFEISETNKCKTKSMSKTKEIK